MQIERLVQMVFYIISRERVTAKELADHFDVSTRTIYRDITTLSIAGIPVISARGTGGGISLISGYTIDKSLLSKEEQQNIYQGLQILQATNYPNAEIALSKIGAVFRNALESRWLEVDFSYWGSKEKEKVRISELQYAIVNKHLIGFYYFNTELQQSERMIEPLRLMFKSHAWYVVGYCRDREEIRIFRLSRMRKIRVLPEVFERLLPADFSLVSGCREEEAIPLWKLKFDAEMAHKIYDDFHEDQVLVCEDGKFMVTMRLELNNWAFNYLLSFGPYVEVVEPAEARVMLKARALAIAGIYDSQ